MYLDDKRCENHCEEESRRCGGLRSGAERIP